MSEKTDNVKFIYEKAIERYLDFEKKYKEWVYMYAIFIGALFIAYYSLISDNCKSDVCQSNVCFLLILIPVIGILTGFCWLGAFYGHRKWLLSWNKVLLFHEERYLQEVCKEEEERKKYRLWSLVHEESLRKYGFSTQTITNLFIRLVIIAWSFILCYSILGFCWIWATILFVLSLVFIHFSFEKKKKKGETGKRCRLLSDIDSHYKLVEEKRIKYRIVDPKRKIEL